MALKLQPHKPFGFNLRLDQASQVEEIAYQRDIPVSRLMREIIEDYLLKLDYEKQSKN